MNGYRQTIPADGQNHAVTDRPCPCRVANFIFRTAPLRALISATSANKRQGYICRQAFPDGKAWSWIEIIKNEIRHFRAMFNPAVFLNGVDAALPASRAIVPYAKKSISFNKSIAKIQ